MAGDGPNALIDLLAAKPAFGGSTEADHLVKLTDGHLRHGDVDWLEVGAGDGHHLLYQLSRLSARRRFRVVALEPAAVGPELTDGIEWLRIRAEDYGVDRQFDWINLRHSAYYFGDPVSEIARLVARLRGKGALALTHWSGGCVLRRLHLAICGEQDNGGSASIEDLAMALHRHPELRVSAIRHFDTKLCIDQVLGDHAVAEALYELVRRGHPALSPANIDRAATVAGLLQELPDATVRRNGLLLVRRWPD